MKTYYNEYMAINTDEGKALWDELNELLCPIIKREFDAGFNPAEIQDMIQSVASLEISVLRLKHGVKIRKEKNK